MKTSMLTRALIASIILFSFQSCSKSDESPGVNSMQIISVEPSTPATLKFNEFVVITFEYNIVEEEGVRMWIIPYSNGDRSPKYLYSSSTVYKGNGTRQVGVSIENGDNPVVVDQLKLTMVNPDQTETFLEQFVNVDFTFE